MLTRLRIPELIVVATAMQALGVGCSAPPPSTTARGTAAQERHFALHVWPLLEAKCHACHGADRDEIEGELDLTSLAGLLQGGESGLPAVVPGKPDESPLIDAIRRNELAMPPKQEDQLSADQIAVLEQWVRGGALWPTAEKQLAIRQADWKATSNEAGTLVKTSGGLSDDWTHRRYQRENLWAYQPVVMPALDAQGEHPIDSFIDSRLAQQGLRAAPRADPLTLIRRVTLDVTGLPPTVAEIQAFRAAWKIDSDQAWSELVDRLLASPHYGEQAARHWLDVVRYADSSGFANDWERPNAWRYRDYVIRAF
ncbi:MAG: DUF1549 domain-containing protein, partial [Bythopirellula sp.]